MIIVHLFPFCENPFHLFSFDNIRCETNYTVFPPDRKISILPDLFQESNNSRVSINAFPRTDRRYVQVRVRRRTRTRRKKEKYAGSRWNLEARAMVSFHRWFRGG